VEKRWSLESLASGIEPILGDDRRGIVPLIDRERPDRDRAQKPADDRRTCLLRRAHDIDHEQEEQQVAEHGGRGAYPELEVARAGKRQHADAEIQDVQQAWHADQHLAPAQQYVHEQRGQRQRANDAHQGHRREARVVGESADPFERHDERRQQEPGVRKRHDASDDGQPAHRGGGGQRRGVRSEHDQQRTAGDSGDSRHCRHACGSARDH
jgi:hypothetical protein